MKLISTFKSKNDTIKNIAPKAYINNGILLFYNSFDQFRKEELIDWIKNVYRFYGWEKIYKDYNICDDMKNWISSVEREYNLVKILHETNK